MGITARRKVYKTSGGTKSLSIPIGLEAGDEHTMAADDLILSDPEGKVPEAILHQWLEEVEGKYHEWKKEQKGAGSTAGLEKEREKS